jgi:hypothetical protein
MTQDTYTGVQGVVTYADAALASAMFDFTVTRGLATGTRSGKWSDLNKPGKVTITGRITRIQRNADLIQAALNATPTTGTAVTLEAAATFSAGTLIPINDAPPTTPSRVRVTLSVDAITTGGTLLIYGTDANDNAISEVLTIANGATATTTWTTRNVFKTCTYALPVTVASTGGGKFQFDAIVGDSTVNVGTPKEFNLIGYVADGSNNITVTLSNCFFTGAKFSFTDANAQTRDDLPFTVTDPDADVIVSGVDA